jgi:hypothetical protein
VKGVGVNSPLVECLEAKKERRLPAPVSLSAINDHVVCIGYSASGCVRVYFFVSLLLYNSVHPWGARWGKA